MAMSPAPTDGPERLPVFRNAAPSRSSLIASAGLSMTHDPNSGVPAAPEDVPPPRRGPGRGQRRYRLDPAARARIGRGLRLLYAEALTQPVPERLERLVARLGAARPACPSEQIEEPPR